MTDLEKRAEEYANKEVYYGAYVDEEAGKEIVKDTYIDATKAETALLSQHIIDLQKDKGNLTDRVRDLERKLEQTEKDLADYQFNYPTINELEKEIAELKLKLEALEGQTPWKDIKDKSEVIGQLTRAKEIIKSLLTCCRNYPQENAEKMYRAEQFLKETK